jgi:TRAP-type mannitol/chloroaromatic compound transport system permease large subunit
MNPWQRLVGTQEEPRRVANPGVVFLAVVLVIGTLYLGLSALTSGRAVQGVGWLAMAIGYVGWVVILLRRRLRADE